jgi:hypothetical protein
MIDTGPRPARVVVIVEVKRRIFGASGPKVLHTDLKQVDGGIRPSHPDPVRNRCRAVHDVPVRGAHYRKLRS